MKIKIQNDIFIDSNSIETSHENLQKIFSWGLSGNSDGNSFKSSNVNCLKFELSKDNSFDHNIKRDLFNKYGEQISSINIFCFDSTDSAKKVPINFDVYLEESETFLCSTCMFSLANIKSIQDDICINNILVEEGRKATIVIIVTTE